MFRTGGGGNDVDDEEEYEDAVADMVVGWNPVLPVPLPPNDIDLVVLPAVVAPVAAPPPIDDVDAVDNDEPDDIRSDDSNRALQITNRSSSNNRSDDNIFDERARMPVVVSLVTAAAGVLGVTNLLSPSPNNKNDDDAADIEFFPPI